MAVFPLAIVLNLPNLWLSPVAVVAQEGRHPRLILDFTWSGLNKSTSCKDPEEVIRFEGTLHRIIRHVLTSDPCLVLVCLGKFDLADAYMRFWVQIEDTPSVEILLP